MATTEKFAAFGAVTVRFAGCVVMLGGTGVGFTVRVAVLLVTVPAPFETTTSREPLSATAVGFTA